MKSILAVLMAILAAPAAVFAQDDDPDQIKKRILQKVRERLETRREALMKRVELIIEEELAKAAPAAKPPSFSEEIQKQIDAIEKKKQELERLKRQQEEQLETLQINKEKLKRLAKDEALRQEAMKEIPPDPTAVGELFDKGIKIHEEKRFEESVKIFKKLFYRFPRTEISFISAYNVACGYALWGKKTEALDWLEISVASGYSDFEHLRQDTDLDSLRGEKRYRKLMVDR